MVFEFAVEPELVATCGEPHNYRYFYEKFGIGQPRIMSEYPKFQNWRRQVLRAASGKDGLELSRIVEMIAMLSEARIPRKTDGYDGNISWLENAEQENNVLPFHAILALSNPRNHPSILNGSELGISKNLKWDMNRQLSAVPRKASDMARAVRPLLHNCHTAIFIDPFFMARDNWQKWQHPFESFMQELPITRYKCSDLRIEYHAAADIQYACSAELFKQRCMERLSVCIPTGLSVCFKRWTQKPGGEKLHDRYIITDIGGVNFSIGLDEGADGETQKISLLEKNTYETVWNDYVSGRPAFNLAAEDEFTIPDCKNVFQ